VGEDNAYFPPLPAHVSDLWARVTEVTPDKLYRTWKEIPCRWDIHHAKSGSHIQL
jgi:hypothetical protein